MIFFLQIFSYAKKEKPTTLPIKLRSKFKISPSLKICGSISKLTNIKLNTYLISVSGLYNHTKKFKAITTTDMKSDEEEESSLENNSEFGLDQIGSNLSKMDQNGSSAKDPIIALLSEYCHSKVLNIDYLLGKSSQPFTNKAAKAKTTSLKRKRSENKPYENQNTHLKNINNPQALSSPPSSSTSLTVSDASSSAVSSPSLPKSGSVSPRPESIIGKLV